MLAPVTAPLARCPAAAVTAPGRPGGPRRWGYAHRRPSGALACAAAASGAASPQSRLLGRRRSPVPMTTTPNPSTSVVVVAAAASSSSSSSPDIPLDNAADPALVAKVRGWIGNASASSAVPATVDPEEARVLLADGNWALLDVRSSLEAEGEGRPLPRHPRSLALPLSEWTSSYDSSAGKKVVAKPAVDPAAFAAEVSTKVVVGSGGGASPSSSSPAAAGLVVLCSGVPDPAAGGLRAALAADALRSSGLKIPVAVLEGGYAAWALKWTNKLERRVVGFVIASGGTSIEQRDGGGGVGSKGSGVAGKGVEDLLAEALLNYAPGGMYA